MPNTEYTNTTTKRINEFYNTGSSIALTNKYIVGFYGPKVTSAVNILKSKNKSFNINELLNVSETPYEGKSYNGVELKWECSAVSIPKGDVIVEKASHYFDAIKAVKHPYVTGVQETAELTITITDTKEMIWYQFFNALKNSFFNTDFFRPVGSSFNKVACYIGVIQGTGKSASSNETDTQGQLLSQLFEFNSIVPSKFGEIKVSHDAHEPLKFSVTFVVPNVFQSTYNVRFKGMRNISGTTYSLDNSNNLIRSENVTYNNKKLKTFYNNNLEDSLTYIQSEYGNKSAKRNKDLETVGTVYKDPSE